jgi:hypothetical protein
MATKSTPMETSESPVLGQIACGDGVDLKPVWTESEFMWGSTSALGKPQISHFRVTFNDYKTISYTSFFKYFSSLCWS